MAAAASAMTKGHHRGIGRAIELPYRALINTNRIYLLIIILINKFTMINVSFIWAGNPKYHVCPFFRGTFAQISDLFWKGIVLSKIMSCSHIL